MSTEEKQNHPPPGAREAGAGEQARIDQALENTRHLLDDPEASDLAKGLYRALEAKRHQPKPPPDDPETDMEPQPEDDGPRILGDPKEGCRFCGAVFSYFNEDFNILTYYPGVECCLGTIDVQLDRLAVRMTQTRGIFDRAPTPGLQREMLELGEEMKRLREKRRELEDRQAGLKDASDAA